MKLITAFLVPVLSVCISLALSAQDYTHEGNASKKTAKAYAEAIELQKAGLTAKAVVALREIVESDPTFIDAPLTLAGILYESDKVSESAQAFEKAIALDSFYHVRSLYSLGRIYLQLGNFTKASKLLARYIERGKPDGTHKTNAEEYLAKACTAERIAGDTVAFEPELLQGPVNTADGEALPAFTVDGMYLLFTRNIKGQEDLYITHWDAQNKAWMIPEPMAAVNTALNEGAHSVSGDGSMIAFTACNRSDGAGSCDIYFWQRVKGEWLRPVNAGGINNDAWDGHPTLSADGTRMYFSSEREGGFGKRDIWYTERHGDLWTRPVNLGSSINTAGNEESPFLFFDNHTLYFMSDGHPGLGDHDLFFSTRTASGWSAPKNMGYPINTAGREGALAIHPNSEYAYFTSDRAGGQNDIYQFRLDSSLLPTPVSNLQGIVTDVLDKSPVIADVYIYDLTDTTQQSLYVTDIDGKFSSVIVHGHPYGIHVSAEGYAFWSDQMFFALTEPYGQKVIQVGLIPLKKDVPINRSPVVLRNIEFETGSSKLLSTSLQELQRLHKLLLDHPEISIEIRGHTDEVGSVEDNRVLSEERARAVYDWLIAHEIDASRLTYIGFGESMPIASNETEEGRQQNRRTEFVID